MVEQVDHSYSIGLDNVSETQNGISNLSKTETLWLPKITIDETLLPRLSYIHHNEVPENLSLYLQSHKFTKYEAVTMVSDLVKDLIEC